MRSRWVPIAILSLLVFALGWGIVSLSVGEHRTEEFQIEGAGEVQELIGGIRQLGDRLGPEDAPITIDVFNDVQCPHCADYQFDVIEPLIREQVRPGNAQMNFHHFPLGTKTVTLGGMASEAAGTEDAQWQYVSLLMRNLDEAPERGVSEDFLREVASSVQRFEVELWNEAMDGTEVVDLAQADNDLATNLKLTADPAVVVSGPSGTEQLEGMPSQEEIEAAMARVG